MKAPSRGIIMNEITLCCCKNTLHTNICKNIYYYTIVFMCAGFYEKYCKLCEPFYYFFYKEPLNIRQFYSFVSGIVQCGEFPPPLAVSP